MRRHIIIATTAAGAVLAAGVIAVPALAAGRGPGPATLGTATPGPSASVTDCPYRDDGTGMGPGNGAGMGRWGNGAGRGRWGSGPAVTDPLAGLQQGSLTSAQRTALAGMAEEEKLAHDVYVALAAATNDVRFTRIAAAEARHLAQVRALLARYGVADPTAGKADGAFASTAIAQQYQDLVARGSASLDAALAVGRDIENADLKALDAAGSGVTAPDALTVYGRLANGSQMHLRAFSR